MKWHLLLCMIVLAGLSSCEDYPTDPIDVEDWDSSLGEFPGVARASGTSFVVGNKAYICLGRSEWKSGFLKDLWEYDPDNDKWTQKTDFPGQARAKAIAGVIGTKAYIGMGSIGAIELSNQFCDFYEYDTRTDIWTKKADFPGEARNDLFCAVVDGALYATLGFTGIQRSVQTWKYDPTTNVWTQMTDAPHEASNAAGFAIGNCFYEGSGFRGSNLNFFYCFRPDIQKWIRKANLPDARMLSNGLAINGKGYILLGRYWNGALNGGRLLSDIVEYDPASDSWTKRGNFPGGARQNAMVFSIGDKGYIMMGEDDAERKSDVWSFRP